MKQLTKNFFIFKIIMVKNMKKIKINDHRARNVLVTVSIVIGILLIVLISCIFTVKLRISKEV